MLRRLLLLCVLLIPAVLSLAIFTELGSRNLLRGAERLLPLEIDYGSGSLDGRLQLQRVRYETDSLRVELHDVVTELAAACLWRRAICLRTLQVGSLEIALLPTSEVEQPDARPETLADLVVFPIALETDSLAIDALRVHWRGGEWRQAALRGRVRLHQSTIEVLSARIVAPQLILKKSDDAQRASGERTLLPPIDLPLILSVDELQLVNPGWDFYGALYQQDEITVRGRWRHSALQLDKLTVHSSELGELALNGTLAFSGDWPIDADANITLAEPLQYSDLLGSTVKLSARGDLAELALQLHCEGTVDVAAKAQVNTLDAALPFSTTLTATSASNLAIGDFEGIPEALQGAEVAFPAVIAVSGSLQTQHFELHGAASGLGYESLSVVLLGQHEQEKLVVSELTIRDAAGTNALRANGEILLSSGYAWSLAVQSSGLDLPALSESVRGRIEGNVQLAGEIHGEQWQVRIADVALQGQVNDMPALISGFAGVDSELRLSSSALQAQLNGANLSLQTAGDDAGPGHLHLTIDDLSRWQKESHGQVELDAEVSADRKQITLEGRLQKVQWSGLRFDTATLAGDYQVAVDHAFHLDTTLTDVAIGDVKFSTLQLLAHGNAQKQSMALSSHGDIQGELAVSGTTQGEQWQGVLAPTRLQTPVGEWVLPDAVAMTGFLTEQRLTVNAHCWQHQYAKLCPGNWSLGSQGSGSVQVQADLEILAALLSPDVDLQGELQMGLDARWAPDEVASVRGNAKTGVVTITQHFAEEESATFGWDEANIGLNYTDKGLQLAVGVQRDAQKIVGVKLLLPPDRSDAIAGAITLDRLKLGAFTPFVPALSTLAGELSGEVSLVGTIDKPRGVGEIKLSGGHLAVEGNPTQLDDLDLTLDVRGDWASIGGRGVLGGGELKLTGRVDTDPNLRLELKIQGVEHTILYPPSTELQISETLQLVLQKNLLHVTGEINVLEGVLELEELPEGSVAVSTSVVEVDADGNILHEELPFDMRINVQVHIADRFRVTGDTVQTTLGGDLRVQQRPGQPLQLFGNLDTSGGEFRAYQTRLQIKRGTISFTGPPDNPTLDVRAERKISRGEVTVGVRVQGPLEDDLQLDIYSDPAMSQADAMSYLVRGRGMDAGAGLDGTAAALSLASGVANRSELVSELNRIPGLSNVEFGAQGSDADTAATVSGYLGERIFLSYGVGLYEPVNVLTTRFYLRSRLWLEIVSSIENSVDLYYSFDID